MDPHYEQRLREEVIYLHSLWHQGPPRQAAGAQTPNLLQPSNTAHFKREGRPRGRRGRKSKKIPNNEAPDSKSSPGKEWPSITPSPAEATSSWGCLAAKPLQLPQSPSPEEHLESAWKKAQSKALKTVREFLKSNDDDSESESGSIDSSSDDDDEFMGGNDGRQEYTFFLRVFMEDAELKDYYEKNLAKGEFSCLICGAVGGKNTWKKFKGCLPLVQHSIAVAKTKRRRAHRAYGQAVCKIFGWDIDRLSTIVSLLSDNSDGLQVGEKAHDKGNSIGTDNNVISKDGNNGKVVPVTATFGSGSLPFTDKVIINSLTGTDANNTLERLDIAQLSNVVETMTEGLPCNSSVADDANNTTEGLGMVDLSNVEVTLAEGSTISCRKMNLSTYILELSPSLVTPEVTNTELQTAIDDLRELVRSSNQSSTVKFQMIDSFKKTMLQEINSMKKDLQAQSSQDVLKSIKETEQRLDTKFDYISSQLSEIIAFLQPRADEKKGEEGSSRSQVVIRSQAELLEDERRRNLAKSSRGKIGERWFM